MILIALAGVGAGAINAIVGSGTLITFPTLVTLGYPPVTSTMSNAIGLVAGSVSGTWGYRRELRGQWHRLRWQLLASLIGAGLGAWLLLHLPEKVFTQVVPVLLVAALVLVVAGPKIQGWASRRAEAAGHPAEHLPPGRMAALVFLTFAVGVYGGYFTAAQGILLMGVMGALLPEDMQRMNAAKNLLVVDGECRCRGGLYAGGVRPDQLAGGGIDRGRFAGGRFPRRALRAAVVAECAAGGDRGGRADRAVPAADSLTRRLVGFRPAAGVFGGDGLWRSLVAHYTGGVGVAGSNPVSPTGQIAVQRHFSEVREVPFRVPHPSLYPNPPTSNCVRRCPTPPRPGRPTGVMNKQEPAWELGYPDAQKLLSGSMARLAYNGHDGFPRVITSGQDPRAATRPCLDSMCSATGTVGHAPLRKKLQPAIQAPFRPRLWAS